MDDSKLSIEQLSALSRAVPEDSERKDLALFLKVIDRWSTCMHLPWTRCAPIWLCFNSQSFYTPSRYMQGQRCKDWQFPKDLSTMHAQLLLDAAHVKQQMVRQKAQALIRRGKKSPILLCTWCLWHALPGKA